MRWPDLRRTAAFAAQPWPRSAAVLTALAERDGDWTALSPKLQALWLQTAANNLHLARVEAEVAAVLSRAGLAPVVPIKGTHWQHTVWRDLPGVRPMVDVDLLLTTAGFRRLPRLVQERSDWQLQTPLPALRAHFAADIQLRVHDTSVELKRHVLLTPVVDLQPLLARARPAAHSPGLMLLPTADALLIDLLHHLNDAVGRQRWNARHIAEFQVLLAQLDRPADFAEHCARHGVLHWLSLWSALTAQVLVQPVWQQPAEPWQPVLHARPDGRIDLPPLPLVHAWLYRRQAPWLLARQALLWAPKRLAQKGKRAT